MHVLCSAGTSVQIRCWCRLHHTGGPSPVKGPGHRSDQVISFRLVRARPGRTRYPSFPPGPLESQGYEGAGPGGALVGPRPGSQAGGGGGWYCESGL